MYISDFKYHKPKSLSEALKILNEIENGTILAGGTDLMVEVKTGVRKVKDFISLSSINDLKDINEDNEFVYIGSNITHNGLVSDTIINKNLPALSEAASKIGSHQIRNAGTIGGNLCTGASCSDTAPILMAYNASVELVSENNSRIIPLRDFFIFHHKTKIEKNEIMTKIIVPKVKDISGSSFEKFGLRESSSISVASTATVLRFESGICSDAAIVIGACGPIPINCKKSVTMLLDQHIRDLSQNIELLLLIGQAASDETIPIDDIRGSAEYRRELVKVITKDALLNAIKRTKINN